MSDYGAIFPQWREAAGPEWTRYTRHAFVEGMRDGSLPRAAFLHYLVQDYIFLIHFSRAWALAVTKAETVEEMRLCAATVNALINEEIALHVRTCAEAGLSEDALQGAEEAAGNLAYTRYVLDAGHSGDLLDLLAALEAVQADDGISVLIVTGAGTAFSAGGDIKALRDKFGIVGFVGDGINDAPALAEADIGLAVGSGTDVAIESADVVLISGDLSGVVNAAHLSQATLRNIRQNLFWAFAYNTALIPVAAGILYPLTGTMLSPMLAAGAMALSSVFVLSNALRLRRVKPALEKGATS